MSKDENKKIYSSLSFLEKRLIPTILILFVTLTVVNYAFDFNVNYQNFIGTTAGKAIFDLKGSLLSISAIFIGIYVTVFTLLGSIKVDSIFAYLNENTFKDLVIYIRNAFIASFSYLILIIVLEVSYEKFTEINYLLVVLNITIVMYMFLTAFRFGIILYIAFSKDLQNLQSNIEKHREEKRRIVELQYRIEKFLDEHEKDMRNNQNNKMSEIINKENE